MGPRPLLGVTGSAGEEQVDGAHAQSDRDLLQRVDADVPVLALEVADEGPRDFRFEGEFLLRPTARDP